MVSEGGSWTPVRSEDLPEGLSDRDEGTRSLEETPSISGSSEGVGPEASWTARSYLSKVVDNDGLDGYRRKYQIPEDVVLRTPESDEVACSSRYGDVAFYEADLKAGIRFPLQPLMRELLDRLNLAPGQLAPNAWRTVVGSMVMWKVLSEGKDDLTLDELLFCYKPCQIPASPGFWSLNMRQRGLKLIVGTPSSNREWKDNYVFVCGDNWEGLQCEKDDNFIPVRREWGVPSSSGMATAKLNREKLKKMMMSQHEEAPLVIGKKRKADASSKKATEERILPPPPPVQKLSIPEPVPTSSIEVVEITVDPSPSRPVERVPTLPRDASLACRRAKSVVTKDDVGEYEKVNTDVIKVAGVHSLMKGCGRVVGEMSTLKVDMARKEEELLKALDGAKKSDDQVKMLSSKLETARVAAVEEFKSSEAFDDINTKYFLSGFSFLKKQAKEKYKDLDFEVFQPFDDEESVMPVDDGNEGTTSADPQMDDDATS
uniref:Uncharacterized protein n=1 Tax=Fagus sylvatica TaxID=28930 RepID=A0A2N9I0S5_FAGSY